MRTPVSNFACAAKAFIFRTFSSIRFSCLLTRAFTPAASPASIFIKIRARPPYLCLARPNPLALGFDSVFYRVPFSRCRRADPYGAALCSLPCRAGRPAYKRLLSSGVPIYLYAHGPGRRLCGKRKIGRPYGLPIRKYGIFAYPQLSFSESHLPPLPFFAPEPSRGRRPLLGQSPSYGQTPLLRHCSARGQFSLQTLVATAF